MRLALSLLGEWKATINEHSRRMETLHWRAARLLRVVRFPPCDFDHFSLVICSTKSSLFNYCHYYLNGI